jgi:RND superfamily putative drug exporter
VGATEKPGAADRQGASADGLQLGVIGRFGRFVFRHHRWVGLLWLVILIGAGALATADHGATSNNFSVPGADSQAAYDLLQDRFQSQNAATAQVVLQSAEGSTLQADATGVASMVAALEKVPGVASVSNPLTSDVTEALQQVAGSLPPAEQQAAKDERQMTAVAERLNTAIQTVKAGVFMPANPDSWWCSQKYCEYFGDCKYALGGREE